jgi:VanZ family protein
MKTKKIISYLLLIFWMYVIFYLSNQTGTVSGLESSHILYNVLSFFHISNIDSVIEIIHNPLRECMHAFEYFILSILVINILNQYNIKKNIIIITVCLCFIYAVTDEIHQIFVPNRTFEYLDITLDLIGALLGSYLFEMIIKYRKLRKS